MHKHVVSWALAAGGLLGLAGTAQAGWGRIISPVVSPPAQPVLVGRYVVPNPAVPNTAYYAPPANVVPAYYPAPIYPAPMASVAPAYSAPVMVARPAMVAPAYAPLMAPPAVLPPPPRFRFRSAAPAVYATPVYLWP